MLPVVLLQRGPEDVPYSTNLLWTALAAVSLLSVITGYWIALAGGTVGDWGLFTHITELAVLVLIFVGFVTVALATQGLSARLTQTLTASFGAGAVMQLVFMTLVLTQILGLPLAIIQPLAILIWMWSIVVDGYILASALKLNRIVGCVVALFVFVVQDIAINALQGGH